MSSLSKRGASFKYFHDKLHQSISLMLKKRMDSEDLMVNFGTSENRLMFDVLNEKFSKPENCVVHQEYTQYADESGYQSFRDAAAKFFNHVMKPAKPVLAENLIALNGAGSVIEVLGMTLADAGEGFLIPAPYYGGFDKDLGTRARVQIVPAHIPSQSCDGKRQYKLTVGILEDAYNDAMQKGIFIRAMILVNPNNPFGYIYSEEELQSYLDFAHRHNIHLIVDEIYMLSIFKEGVSMKSILSFENVSDSNHLHVIWGLSKDFCVSGFRCGFLHTTNQDLIDSLKKIVEFQQVSPLVQHKFTNILEDLDWIDNVYTPTNHKRLRENYKTMCETLNNCDIPYLEADAGFFIWADLRKLMKTKTEEEELRLFHAFLDENLYVVGGSSFSSREYGWFRLIFTNKPDILALGLKKFTKVVDSLRKELEI